MDGQTARKLLEEERQRLLDLKDTFRIQDLEREMEQESVGELSSIDQHPGELGTETFEREKAESIKVSIDSQLADVDRAFDRLGDGTYGFCEICGNPISEERLRARPAARYCIDDQARMERGTP